MNKALFSFSILGLLSLSAGCSKTNDAVCENGRLVSISAVITSDDSKAIVNDAGQFTWASGDAIGVYTSDGKFTSFEIKDGEEGKSSAVFTAILADGVDVVGPAVYPYRGGHGYDALNRIITFSIPETEAYSAGSTKSPMIAEMSGTGGFSFSHVCGLIRVTLYNIPASAKYVRFSSFNSKISGSFSVDLNDPDGPVIEAETSSQRTDLTFTLTPDNVTGKSYTFNFPAPVGVYNNIRLAWYDSSWNMTTVKTSTSSNVINKGTLLLMPNLSLNTVLLSDFQGDELPANFKGDSSYPAGFTQNSIVNNPKKTAANNSSTVLVNNSDQWDTASGYFEFNTQEAHYSSGYRTGAKGFRMKVLYNNPEEALMYFPHVDIKGPNTGKVLPSLINGEPFSPQSTEKWAALIKTDDWNVLQYDADCSGAYNLIVRPLVYIDATQKAGGTKIIYMDDFEFIK